MAKETTITDTYLGFGLWLNPRQNRIEARHHTRGVIAWIAVESLSLTPFRLYEWWDEVWQGWARALREGR